ncbi:MAG: DUF169 domain-containing protein [Candidatus Lernaella stagnicola]|nr:DUF169 domain-containing protein [Candidatus Lernaella stagnicola]
MAIHLPVPPVGAKVLDSLPETMTDTPIFHGVSFCEAVDQAAHGRAHFVTAESIHTCRWVPPVLGFVEPSSKFEEDIAPTLPPGTAGVFLALLANFPESWEPDVVIVKAAPEILSRLAEMVGWDMAAWDYVEEDRIAKSALKRLREEDRSWRTKLIKPFNNALAAMDKIPGFKKATILAFKSEAVSAAFEAFISRALASMSVCRNSLVIPYLSGRFNISYLCSGGVTWGGNYPFHLTSGWPWKLWQRLASDVDW